MITIGVTGPSGAGKGTVCEIMRNYGFHIIDADKVYHNLIVPPSDCLDELVRHFDKGIISEDGTLIRSELAARVFLPKDSKKQLKLLNDITHKYVVRDIRAIVDSVRDTVPACVIDAPLLFNAGLQSDCDFIIGVLADIDIRANRVAMRDGISSELAHARFDSQHKDDYFIRKCDHIVYNNGDTDALKVSVDNILKGRGLI